MGISRRNIGLVIPAFHEQETIMTVLKNIELQSIVGLCVYIVVDYENDPTIYAVETFKQNSSLDIRTLIQGESRGAASALNFGIENSREDYLVFCAGDNSDDVSDISALIRILEDGYSVASASRYTHGGMHLGGPAIKHFLSKLAGRISFFILRSGTTDPTNLFKAVRREFLDNIKLESRKGFTLGLEMVAKAQLHSKKPVKDTPTIWHERTVGKSQFAFFKWLPSYIFWFIILVINSLKKARANLFTRRGQQ